MSCRRYFEGNSQNNATDDYTMRVLQRKKNQIRRSKVRAAKVRPIYNQSTEVLMGVDLIDYIIIFNSTICNSQRKFNFIAVSELWRTLFLIFRESCCVILKKKELTPSNSTVHYVSIIKIFLVNGIQAVLEYGVGIRTTPKNIKYFRTL